MTRQQMLDAQDWHESDLDLVRTHLDRFPHQR